jgi:hypothetical protein
VNMNLAIDRGTGKLADQMPRELTNEEAALLGGRK